MEPSNIQNALLTQTPEQFYKSGNVPKIPMIFSMTSNDLELLHIGKTTQKMKSIVYIFSDFLLI